MTVIPVHVVRAREQEAALSRRVASLHGEVAEARAALAEARRELITTLRDLDHARAALNQLHNLPSWQVVEALAICDHH